MEKPEHKNIPNQKLFAEIIKVSGIESSSRILKCKERNLYYVRRGERRKQYETQNN
jgi:hypothetical protein